MPADRSRKALWLQIHINATWAEITNRNNGLSVREAGASVKCGSVGEILTWRTARRRKPKQKVDSETRQESEIRKKAESARQALGSGFGPWGFCLSISA